MNELIPIKYNGDMPVVSGRKLHKTLDVNTPYHIWFPRMCEYGFVENVDFTSFEQKCSGSQGGRPSSDHELSIPMAKEIAMLQRNEKGKTVRRYLIAVDLRAALKPIIRGGFLMERIIAQNKFEKYFSNLLTFCIPTYIMVCRK